MLPTADTIPDARKLLAMTLPETLMFGMINPPDPM
jgi:hypothetical protein